MDIQMTWNLEDLFASAGEWEIGLQKAKELFEQLAARKGHAADTAADLLETAKLYERANILFEQLAVYAACGCFHTCIQGVCDMSRPPAILPAGRREDGAEIRPNLDETGK